MCRGDRGDVWSLGRALVSLEEEETRAQARTEEPVRMQGQDGRPHAEARGLRRAWPCPQPGHLQSQRSTPPQGVVNKSAPQQCAVLSWYLIP